MPTGTREAPDAFTEALMAVVRAKMGMMRPSLTITDVSNKTGIPRSSLSRIISGKRQPDLNQVRLIAIAINMPMAQLVASAEDIMAGKDPFKS